MSLIKQLWIATIVLVVLVFAARPELRERHIDQINWFRNI